MNFKNYLKELKRRNVIKAALAYLVISWIIIQVATTVLPTFEAPAYISKTIIFILALGFPLWLIFSWVYEITPEGIRKTKSIKPEESITPETSNRLNKIIIGGLGLVIVLLAFNMLGNNQTDETSEIRKELASTDASDKSIAVLAFADMSPDKDQEYFSDGISEEILNLLAKIPDLKVISRTSSFSFKGKNVTTEDIGKQLQVGHVLEGSVRKSGNTFRITTQLIDVKSGAHVWSETYDQDMEDIFEIQDRIAAVVTKQLKGTLLGDEFKTKKVDPKAYDLFLMALDARKLGTSEANIRAEKIIRESIAIDSAYAPSWALLSTIIHSGNSFGIRSLKDEVIQSKKAAQKAIELDSTFAQGYVNLSISNRREWDFENSSLNMKKALELAPENSIVVLAGAEEARDLGKIDYAISLANKASGIDPLNYGSYFRLASFYSYKEEYYKAEEALKKYLFMYEDSRWTHNFLAQIYLGQENIEKAMEEIEQDSDPFWSLFIKNMIVYKSGDKKRADKLLQELIEKYGHDSWPNIAVVYAYRNENDQAFHWLEESFKVKDGSLFGLLNYPAFKSLHGDPRWNKFINKLGLPDDHGFHMD